MEENDLNSSTVSRVSGDVGGPGFSLRFRVKTRAIAWPARELRNETFTFLKTVDVLSIISDKSTAISKNFDEFVGFGGFFDFKSLLS